MSGRAFVTGASGFVGANLVRELTSQGWQVTALVRESSPLEDISGLGLDLRIGDITDRASLDSAMPKEADCVFHVAASTNIWAKNNDAQTRVNVDGTRNVVEAAVAAGAVRMVHTSSFIVWGFHTGLLTESCEHIEADGWINYIRTKRLAERIVKDAVAEGRIDATICNPAHILGPGDRHNWSRMIRLVSQGKLPGVPPGGGAFADVREVARAHISAFHKGRRGENYILGGEDTMFLEVIRITGEILGRKVPTKASPSWLLRTVARVYVALAAINGKEPDLTPEGAAMITRHIECDSGKAQRELNYRFTPVRELLQDTCTWMHHKGMLT